jgi:ubiquinone/menaquinone biosynthesis C-methylase UbiE
MMGLRWRPAQVAEPEWMDWPGHPPAVIADNLNDLRRVNALVGGVRLTLLPFARLAPQLPAGRAARVLDVASGGADIPRALAAWLRRRGRPSLVVVSDMNPEFLAVARDQWPDRGRLVYLAADATRLPFLAGAFDVVTCSLAMHHLLRDEALAMLTEMRRCATVGVVVNDIVRNWVGYCGAILATRFGSRNVLTRHDGPLSVLRAYTAQEMRELAHQAGLRLMSWHSFVFYRVGFSAVPAAPVSLERLAPLGPQLPARPGKSAPLAAGVQTPRETPAPPAVVVV